MKLKLGETRIHVESCESTQALLDPSMAEGTVAVADVQTFASAADLPAVFRGRFHHTADRLADVLALFGIGTEPDRDGADRALVAAAHVRGAEIAALAVRAA